MENAHELLGFTQHIITSWLVKLDAVLTTSKVNQTLLYIFTRTANNDAYYIGYLTALRP